MRKIKKTISAFLLASVALCFAMMPLSASAAASSVQGCNHKYVKYDTTVTYTHADNSGHRKKIIDYYKCSECDEEMSMEETIDEPHNPGISATVACECGFKPRY